MGPTPAAPGQYISNATWTGPSVAAFGGPSSSTSVSLLTAGYDLSDILNASSSSSFLFSHGTLGIFQSAGGATWSTSYAGQATDWTNTLSRNYGDIFEPSLDLQNFFAMAPANQVAVFPLVTANATGSDALVVAPFGPVCFTVNLGSCGDTNAHVNATYNAAWGIATTQTTDGGASWGTPLPIYSKSWWRPVWYDGSCTTSTATSGIYLLPGNQTTSVSLASNSANGYAYVAWTADEWVTPAAPWACLSTGLFFYISSLAFSVYARTSTAGGASWGAPTRIAQNVYAFSGTPTPLSNVHLTVGPAPSYTVTGAFDDFVNSSSSGFTTAVASFSSANNGKSWTYHGDTGLQPEFVSSTGPDWFFNGTIPWIVADGGSGSPYAGNQYMVWNDFLNGSGPPSILFARNTGTGWIGTRIVSASSLGLSYYNPTIAVGADGTIWIAYLGVNPTSGSFAPYAVYSKDGGSNWSFQFRISDALSTPSTTPQFDGPGFPAVAATATGAVVIWSDCRKGACHAPGRVPNWTALAAFVDPVVISSNAAAVHANVSVFGSTSRLLLPASVGWVRNASVTIGVPRFFLTPNGTYFNVFSTLLGASTDSTDPATFTFTGGNLTVRYAVVASASITGDLRPQAPGANLTLSLAGDRPIFQTLAPMSSGSNGYYAFALAVPGGQTFTLQASAKDYIGNTTTVTVQELQTVTVHIRLARTLGWIAGTVRSTVPGGSAGSVLTINSTVATAAEFNRTSGRFNVSVGWGSYALKVTKTGFLPYSSPLLVVSPGAGVALDPVLVGSWLNGSVAPGAGAVVEVNGTPIVLTAGGRFSYPVPGGSYVVTAHANGFSYYRGHWTVAPGASRTIPIVLTEFGIILGSVSPPSNHSKRAAVSVNHAGVPVAADGTFNASVVAAGAPINVTASLAGYQPSTKFVSVEAGNSTWQNFSLTPVPPSCTGAHCGSSNCTSSANCPGGGGSGPSSGPPLYAYGIGAIVAAALAAVAVLVLLRRRSARAGRAVEAPEETVAVESGPSEIYGADRAAPWGETGPEGDSAPPPG